METRANAHLDYCVFYWRNCNGDVPLMFGKQCIYLPVFYKIKSTPLVLQ